MASAGAVSSSGGGSSGSGGNGASASGQDPIQEQIRQLDDARKSVLAYVSHIPMFVQGILPLLNPSSLPALRRWAADFLAEAFAAPALPSREKESLALLVLESIKGMLENGAEDRYVLSSIVQAAASIYPLVLRWVMANSYDTATWERIGAVKARILQLWDAPASSVRICCIKFAQRVVLAQTPAAPSTAEHRRDALDVSLKSVPAGHPLLDPRHLEAEATGLLDRMLSVLQDNSSDVVVVDATLNTLSVLVRTRPTTANRILNTVLAFDPFRLATASASGGVLAPRTRVVVKSMEKTVRMLLMHLAKRDPHNALVQRMQQHAERLMRTRAEVLDDSRKRHGAEQASDAKRQKTASSVSGVQRQIPSRQRTQTTDIPPLGPPPHSLADIFAITTSAHLRSFNASVVPAELAAKISVSTLARVDAQFLQRAIAGIRERLATLDAASATSALDPKTAPLDADAVGATSGGGSGVGDDDDEYDPDADFAPAEDAEQILNKLEQEGTLTQSHPTSTSMSTDMAGDSMDLAGPSSLGLGLGAFHLPAAPALRPEAALEVGEATVVRVFGMVHESDEAAGAGKTAKPGLNRVAATTYDKDAWITILTRLATRATAGLDDDDEEDEDTNMEGNDVKGKAVAAMTKAKTPALNDRIRELLFRYVLEDFRKRIDTAIAWLCEEWYACRLRDNCNDDTSGRTTVYDVWAVRVLDGFVPYLNAQDKKVLTRFLSGIPALSAELLSRLTSLCRDPSMVMVALTALMYQLKMRPPARAVTLDTLEDIYRKFEDARPMTRKFLVTYRPAFVAEQEAEEDKAEAKAKTEAETEAKAKTEADTTNTDTHMADADAAPAPE